jgi:RNA polymerase-binding transcription factor DksA
MAKDPRAQHETDAGRIAARLAAIPDAETCAACQQALERGGTQPHAA